MASLFEDASLVMIPSGYKDGKVYSIKPTNGDGDLTFTRSNDTATRVGPDGLIEKVRTNLALQSQSFATSAVWSTVNGTITDNVGIAPDGTNTASKIIAPSADPFVYQTLTLSGQVAVSCYVKGIGSSIGKTGSIRAGASTFVFTISGDWERFVVVHNAGGAETYGLETPEAAAVSDEVLLWGFQVEYGDISTDYIATTTAAVSVGPVANLPRLDYLDSSCPKLLLEPQRTNLVTYSEQINQWLQERTSVTANAITSPDGYTNADKVNADSTPDTTHQTYNGPYTNTAGNVAFSGFFKKGEYDWVHFGAGSANSKAWFNLNTGVVGSTQSDVVTTSMVDYGNGWYRCISVVNLASTSNYVEFGPASVDNSRVISGTPSGGIYGWGIQMENASSYATSYTPTLSAASTRGADDALKTGISSLIGQTEGVVFLDFEIQNPISAQTSDPVLWYMKDGSGGERYVELYSTGDLVYVEVAASVIANIQKTGLTVGRHKCAVAYAPNDMTFFVDGIQIGTSTSGTPNGFSTFALQYYSATYTGQQMVNQTLLFKTRLTNAELASLTTL
jgi:hypothetical protein